MSDELEPFDPEQAELLLYLADELPFARRQAIERRLASELGLRGQLEAMRAAQEQASSAIAQADESQPLHASSRLAQVAVRQWTIRRLAQAAAATPAQRRGRNWLAPALVAAAAVAAAIWIWRAVPTPSSAPMQPDVGPGVLASNTPEPAPVAQSDDLWRTSALDEAESELNSVAYMQQSFAQ